MNEDKQRDLQRFDIENMLPAGFHDLPEDEKRCVIQKLQEQDIKIRGELLHKYGKSKIAEHDLAVGIDAVQKLDHERKIYSKHIKGENGSGTFELHIRGGDTKFIIPILVVVGIIILGIILIIALLK